MVTPKILRRTISADTAAELTAIMEQVVERGTGKTFAQIPGYTIAGKTGTATKLINGRYSNSDYNASFVGFLPSRDPAVTIIVVIDSPHGSGGHFGGPVSGPIFRRIAEDTLRYLGIGPSIDPAPPVLIARQPEEPSRPAATLQVTQPVVSLVADGPSDTVPDLRGLSARDAMRTLARLGMSARLSGSGSVVSQQPLPGEPLEASGVCSLMLARVPSKTLASAQP